MRSLSVALLSTSLILGWVTFPFAAELRPSRPSTVDLGSYRGSAYYTVEKGGYRVVATLAAVNTGAEQSQVIRLVTTLNPDQTVRLSVPGTLGADGREATVAFSRLGDRVEVASADAAY